MKMCEKCRVPTLAVQSIHVGDLMPDCPDGQIWLCAPHLQEASDLLTENMRGVHQMVDDARSRGMDLSQLMSQMRRENDWLNQVGDRLPDDALEWQLRQVKAVWEMTS